MSIHSSKAWRQAFCAQRSTLQSLPGPHHCQLSCLKCMSASWFVMALVYTWKRAQLYASGRANEWKVCERTHCGKRSLPVFTPVRRENRNKRRMEVRMKRVRHERHILREFMKGGRRQWLLLFFYPFWNCPSEHLAPFVVVFLHSCRDSQFYTFYKQLHRL